MVRARMVGDAEIREDERRRQVGADFLERTPGAVEPFLELAVESVLCPGRVRGLMDQDTGMMFGAAERRERRHEDPVLRDIVVRMMVADLERDARAATGPGA